VMVKKMASDKAITMMTSALTKAVEKGTAKSIYTPNLKIAGKTGTARILYWLPGPMRYQASFAGFYPSDNPKYTCIVVVNQPDKSKGYAGGTVSAPVFKEIAGKTFLKTPLNVEKELLVEHKVDLSKMIEPNVKVNIKKDSMPKLVGMIGKNVIPQLENLGYRVDYKGVGKITGQFPAEGATIGKNQKIYLNLQN
ncbi:MAG: PASTA domain-containing protein, partial [Chryseobacterium sp.]|nr:PASTA domain-containing protein [Chryseobacterium sp.]